MMHTYIHTYVHLIKDFKEITFPGYIRMYTGVHLDVSQESYYLELFDLKIKLLVEVSVYL